MNELAHDRPKSKPPRLSHVVAVFLELGIVVDIARHRSVIGLLLCIAYAWFSATWAAFFGTRD